MQAVEEAATRAAVRAKVSLFAAELARAAAMGRAARGKRARGTQLLPATGVPSGATRWIACLAGAERRIVWRLRNERDAAASVAGRLDLIISPAAGY
jgi:hypothetical protein